MEPVRVKDCQLYPCLVPAGHTHKRVRVSNWSVGGTSAVKLTGRLLRYPSVLSRTVKSSTFGSDGKKLVLRGYVVHCCGPLEIFVDAVHVTRYKMLVHPGLPRMALGQTHVGGKTVNSTVLLTESELTSNGKLGCQRKPR